LIQQSRLKDRLIVQIKSRHPFAVRFNRKFAHAKIALRLILPHPNRDRIQGGRFGCPGFKRVQFQDQRLVRHAADSAASAFDLTGESSLCLHSDFNLRGIKIGANSQSLNIVRWYAFHPDSLPDTGLRRVPDSTPLDLLFSARVPGGIRPVLNPHDEHILLPRLPQRSQINREWQKTADMFASEFPVQIYSRDLIHRAKMQQQPADEKTFRNADQTAIPERFIRHQDSVDTAQFRFRRERHQDMSIKFSWLFSSS